MFIQTEETPNPETLKFMPGMDVTAKGTVECRSVDEAGSSPLAQRLFNIHGVQSILFGPDFIAVTKEEARDWDSLKSHIIWAIMEHHTAGLPFLEQDNATEAGHSKADENAERKGRNEADDEIIGQIAEILEMRVRPAVAQDGGDIVFSHFEDGVVYLHMRGACSGCPQSTITLKDGIERMLKHFVPEVVAVEAVNA